MRIADRYETVSTKYFNLNEKSKDYSEKWEFMQTTIDYEKREITTFFKSRWNSTYDRKDIVKF